MLIVKPAMRCTPGEHRMKASTKTIATACQHAHLYSVKSSILLEHWLDQI